MSCSWNYIYVMLYSNKFGKNIWLVLKSQESNGSECDDDLTYPIFPFELHSQDIMYATIKQCLAVFWRYVWCFYNSVLSKIFTRISCVQDKITQTDRRWIIPVTIILTGDGGRGSLVAAITIQGTRDVLLLRPTFHTWRIEIAVVNGGYSACC